MAIDTATILQIGTESVSPALTGGPHLPITLSTGNALEVSLDSSATLWGVYADDVVAIVLHTVRSINLPSVSVAMEPCCMVVHVRTASLSDTVYIPCTDTLGIVEHLVVELFLCDACQALVGLNRIFGFLLFTPQTANKLLSMQHAPVVLNKEVGVAPVLMQQILVALIKILG